MVNKLWIGLAVIIVLVGGFMVFGITEPDENAVRAGITGNTVNSGEFSGEKIQVNLETSKFEFEGYGPGKSHVGTFDNWNAELFVDSGKVVGFEGIIDADSFR